MHLDVCASKIGFTLAEVLITLGIIGVVAALTLPTVIQNYKKREVETKLVRFSSVINQALKMAEAEHGERSAWDDMGRSCELKDEEAETLECVEGSESVLSWYNKYLAKYVKIAKYSFKVNEEDDVSLALYFYDGTVAVFCDGGWNFFTSEKAYLQHPNPEQFGKDVFPFTLTNKGLVPNISGGGSETCKKDKRGVGCLELIVQNGWKIPDDYPFKF